MCLFFFKYALQLSYYTKGQNVKTLLIIFFFFFNYVYIIIDEITLGIPRIQTYVHIIWEYSQHISMYYGVRSIVASRIICQDHCRETPRISNNVLHYPEFEARTSNAMCLMLLTLAPSPLSIIRTFKNR